MSQKLPPQSLEAEYSVLGGLMLEREAYDQIADLINDSDFYITEPNRSNWILDWIGLSIGYI